MENKILPVDVIVGGKLEEEDNGSFWGSLSNNFSS